MRKIHVVIVEDNIDLAEEMAFYLEHLEMSVITFQSGKRLDGWLENNICDVLIFTNSTLKCNSSIHAACRLSSLKNTA
jgi:DNA-binding response OmpR family regulator